MVLQPSMIKRPVLAHQGKLILGFKAEQYQQFFI
jgi:arsenate reductase-like glutaredoxin family protein